MVVTAMKVTFRKNLQKKYVTEIVKTLTKKFKIQACNLNGQFNCFEILEQIFINTLDKHALLKKKVLRTNQAPYIAKALRIGIMRRSQI